MNNALLYLGILLVAALAALFAGPSFVDWGRYRSSFEAEASRLLAREVRVAGPIAVSLLPVPSMRFEKVRIADPAAEFGEPLLRAEVFTLHLAVPPLLKGAIDATRIEIDQPTVRLVQDGKGGGNWRSIATATGPMLPFAPADVSLGDVRVRNGTVTLHGADGNERSRISGITGELSATTLLGPWRVRADLDVGGLRRELRVATAPPDSEGKVRFKATLSSEARTTNWTLDGVATDPLGRPSLEGDLSARLPVATGARPALAEFKSRAKADSRGFSIEDLSVAFETEAQPQVLGGTVQGTWEAELSLEARLAAQWLDLDRIGGDGAHDGGRGHGRAGGRGAGTLGTAHGALERLLRYFPEAGRGRYAMTIQQASLGEEVVSDVRVEVVRDESGLKLEHLEAGLPGSTRLAAAGTLALGRSLRFDGDVRLFGSSLPRLLSWATGGVPVPEISGPGTFSLIARASLDERSIALRSARAEAGGSRARGTLVYGGGTPRKLTIELDADSLELPRLGVAVLDRSSAMATIRSLVGAGLDVDAHLRVSAAAIGAHRLEDVVLRATLTGDTLALSTLELALADGTRLAVDGRLHDVAGDPRGTLRGNVRLASSAGREIIGSLVDLPGPMRTLEETTLVALPAGLAGTAHFGSRAPRSLDLRIDGRHAGGSLELDLALDGGTTAWQAKPLEMRLALSGSAVEAWLGKGNATRGAAEEPTEAPKPPRTAKAAAPAKPAPSRLLLEVKGPDAERLGLLAAVETNDGRFTYTGQASVAGADDATGSAAPAGPAVSDAVWGDDWLGRLLRRTSTKGHLVADVRDAAMLSRLAGVTPPPGLAGIPFAGRLDVDRQGLRARVEGYDLGLGGRRFGGWLGIERDATGSGSTLTGRLDVDHLSLAALAPVQATTSATPVMPDGTVWGDAPIDLSGIETLRSSIELAASALEIAPGVVLGRGTLRLTTTPDSLVLEDVSAPVLGGRLQGRVALTRVAAGAELAVRLSIANGRFDTLAGPAGGLAVASGEFDIEVAMTGRALSLRGLAGAVRGNGALTLRAATLDRLAPTAIAMVAENYLSGKIAGIEAAAEAVPGTTPGATTTSPVVTALYGELGRGRVELGARRVPITIADGVLEVERFTAPATSGRVEVATRLDLASLVADSDWRLELQLSGVRGRETPRPLPSVTVGFIGPLGVWSELRTRVDAGALERELVVLRMEREVRELERLRREDELRAEREAERQRLQEMLQRGEQGPAAVPPPPGSAVPAPPSSAPNVGPGALPAPQLSAPPRPAVPPNSPEAPSPGQRSEAPASATPVGLPSGWQPLAPLSTPSAQALPPLHGTVATPPASAPSAEPVADSDTTPMPPSAVAPSPPPYTAAPTANVAKPPAKRPWRRQVFEPAAQP